jgi:hypothetical protein
MKRSRTSLDLLAMDVTAVVACLERLAPALCALLGAGAVFGASSSLYAQGTDASDMAMPGAEVPAATQGAVSAEVGFGQIDEDYFLNLDLRFTLGLPVPAVGCFAGDDCLTRLRLGVAAPLRFRVIDREPYQGTGLRKEDWLEFSDYLRVLRFVEYGYPHEAFYGRVGELGPVVLGHGTIVNGYYNVITTDHYQLGVHANVNTVYGGVETLVNNVARPTLVGARTYVRPMAFVDKDSFLTRFAVGLNLMNDLSAPTRLQRDEDGAVVVGPALRPVVDEAQWTSIGGIDFEFNLVRNKYVQITPYQDFNYHFGLGGGSHSGILANVWPTETLGLFSRLEYRYLGQNYLPDYFGPLYEVDRYQFAGWGAELPAPKLRLARSLEGGRRHGVYGQAGVNVFGLVQAGASYEDYQGPDNSALRLRVAIDPGSLFQLAAFYHKQGFDGFEGIFELDGAMLVTEARVSILGPLYARAQYSRLWSLSDDGSYETVQDWNVGIGAGFAF